MLTLFLLVLVYVVLGIDLTTCLNQDCLLLSIEKPLWNKKITKIILLSAQKCRPSTKILTGGCQNFLRIESGLWRSCPAKGRSRRRGWGLGWTNTRMVRTSFQIDNLHLHYCIKNKVIQVIKCNGIEMSRT